MINKDIVYIVCFILIVINCLVYTYDVPEFLESNIFKLILLILTVIMANKNIYIGFFLGITFLSLNQ
jgi:hypothetical protein